MITDRPTAVIVGAGVFGASTALALARRGWDVTLVERWTPGHGGASSGGDTRLLRYSHGTQPWYTQLAWRARDGWLQLEHETGEQVLVECGLVWFARDEQGWEADSLALLREQRIPVERLGADRVADLFPSVRTDDVAFGLWEPHAGVLRARRGVQAMVRRAGELGATVVSGTAAAPIDGAAPVDGGALAAGDALADGGALVEGGVRGAALVDGEFVTADRVVWACGPWLPTLFPGRFELKVTQQDAVWFTVGADWLGAHVPAWVDFAGAAYGTGDIDGHGFKASSDRQGPQFDVERDDRTALPANIDAARDILAHRFPALASAPLAGTRTCQYTTTIDTEFLIAPLDADSATWVLGGGSGHAYKHGPALGEYVADLLDGSAQPDPRFGVGGRQRSGTLRTAGHEG